MSNKRHKQKSSAKRTTAQKNVVARAWRTLAEFMVSVDVFCGEVQDACRKWPSRQRLTDRDQEKCADAMKQLYARGETVLLRLQSERPLQAFREHSEDDSEAMTAYEHLTQIGIEQVLSEILVKCQSIEDRLRRSFSPDDLEAIRKDFLDLVRRCLLLEQILEPLREKCARHLRGDTLPPHIHADLHQYFDLVATISTDVHDTIEESRVTSGCLRDVMQARLQRVRDVREVMRRVRTFIEKFTDTDVVAACGIDEDDAKEIVSALNWVLGSITFATAIEEFITETWQAATMGVDDDLRKLAEQLKNEIDAMRVESRSLQDAVSACADKASLVAFKGRRRSKPLPPWDQLGMHQKKLVARFVRWRHKCADGRQSSIKRTEISKKWGKGTPKTTMDRLLKHLNDEWQIIDCYAPRANDAKRQREYVFWLAEDAYEAYLPHVVKPGGKGQA